MSRSVRFPFLVVLLPLLTLASFPCLAQTAAFNLPAQPLAESLKAIGAQTGINIMVSPPLVDGKQAPALKATVSVKDALAQLLAGTNLEYHFVNDQTVVIRERSQAPADTVPPAGSSGGPTQDNLKEAGKNSSQNFRMAQVDQASPGSQSVEEKRKKEKEVLQEVVVTGTHIKGVEPVGSPVIVHTREEIDQSGVTTLEQFARVMPENFSGINSSTNQIGSTGFDQTGGNAFVGAGFNLYGLGPKATLTLVNGNRLAAAGSSGSFTDISLIPLAAVDRIEVLGDGASAIYGSDALAGVVNVVLKRDYEGADTNLSFGNTTRGGDDEYNASQALGHSWASGNVMAVYQYDNQQGLQATQRDFVPPQGNPYNLVPKQDSHSAFLTGTQALSEGTLLSLDAHFAHRHYDNDSGALSFTTEDVGTAQEYGGTFGIDQAIASDWHLIASGNYSKLTQADVLTESFSGSAPFTVNTGIDSRLVDGDVHATGTLFSLGNRHVQSAFGTSYRSEWFDEQGIPGLTDLSRRIFSSYGEILVPLVGRDDPKPFVQHLELSIAGRYDHYSDFGATTNPKIGARWSPVTGWYLRASAGTSFKAPALTDLVEMPFWLTESLPDPSSTTGSTDTLINAGSGSSQLKAERAKTFTFGADLQPASLPSLVISASYFHIAYTDRIGNPPVVGSIANIFSQTAALSPFIQRNPSLALVQQIFMSPGFFQDVAGGGPGAVQAIFTDTLFNLASSRESGINASISFSHDLPTAGKLQYSASTTYLIENSFKSESAVPPVELINVIYQPVSLRLRGGVNWSFKDFGSSLTVNYAKGYKNPDFTPADPIGSWFTTDLQVTYKTSADGARAFKGTSVALSCQNLFDRDPPRVVVPPGAGVNIGYDASNANTLGRILTLRVRKQW